MTDHNSCLEISYPSVRCTVKWAQEKGHRKKGHGKKGTGKMGTGKKGTSEKLGKKGTKGKIVFICKLFYYYLINI